MRTHYDNLEIAESAPDVVVKAAYRALSQRYHPDKNPGNKDAVRVMQFLNNAYETLSDPVRRQQYDCFLAQTRQAETAATTANTAPPTRPQPRPAPAYQRPRRSFWHVLLLILCWDFRLTLLAVIFAGAGIASLFEEKRPKQPYSPNPPRAATHTRFAPSTAVPIDTPTTYRPVPPAFIRPTTAPNGRPWPVHASYIPGYQLLATGGLSSVTVDNTRNSSDVFLKLVSLNSVQAYPVRVCFIPAHSQFKFQAVAAGRYDVRYRDLSSGGYSKTVEFTLTETKTNPGTGVSLTLYKVANGNMRTETIDESEF